MLRNEKKIYSRKWYEQLVTYKISNSVLKMCRNCVRVRHRVAKGIYGYMSYDFAQSSLIARSNAHLKSVKH